MAQMIPRANNRGNGFVRVGPGQYRGADGKIVNSMSNPNATKPPAQAATNASTPPATNRAATGNYTRVGPGMWKGPDGKVVRSAQNPGRTAAKPPAQAAQTPPPAAATTPPPPAPDVQPQAPTTDAPAPVVNAGSEQAAYRTYRDFLPRDIASSPEYQWKLQQSQKALDAKLAAMGLSSSGKAVADELGMVRGITADEITRQTDLAKDEADRFERLQENQANRQERIDNNQFERTMSMLGLMTRQNPLEYAYRATDSMGDLFTGQGKYNAGVEADQYGRIQGGGGSMAPVYTPPFASSPDYSEYEKWKAGARASNSNDITQTISQLVGMFGGFGG